MNHIDRIVRKCVRYWRRTRVPRAAVLEMRAELAAHLRDAAAEGKSVTTVIGPDEVAFAEAWAREHRPPHVEPPPWTRVGPAVLALLVAAALLGLTFLIPVTYETETIVCCPERVVESSSEPVEAGRVLVSVLWLGSVLALASAVLMLVGKVVLASVALGAAAVVAMLTPMTWIAAVVLLVTLAWAQWIFRRSQPATTVAPVP